MIDKEIEVVSLTEQSIVTVDGESISIISQGQQGPAGAQGPIGPQGEPGLKGDRGEPGFGVVDIPEHIILDGATVSVDSVANARSAKWMLTLSSQSSFQTFEMMGLNTGSDAEFVSYGFIGGSINYAVDVQLDGPDLALKITNNEPSALLVNAVRLATTF